jgi:hypothetical protein
VVAGLGEQLGGLAVVGALVDEPAAADQRAPLGVAGRVLGEVHRQRGGEQPDWQAQPELGEQHVMASWPMLSFVPSGPKPSSNATYCQKCWWT